LFFLCVFLFFLYLCDVGLWIGMMGVGATHAVWT